MPTASGTRARVFRMLRRFAASEEGRKARWFFALLLGLLLAINGFNVLNSYVGRDFMTALERRAESEFLRQAALYVGVFAISTLTIVFLRFTEETLALTWRAWLTRWAVRRYLTPPVYLRLRDRTIADGELANPDQRMSDDIRSFTTMSLSLLILFLNGTFAILAFSSVMWSISPALFFVTVGYAAAGSLMTIARGKPLVKLNALQLDKDANFRAELIHARENAEALAIAGREDRLLSRLLGRIDDLAANLRRIIAVNRGLGLFTTGYNYLIQVIPALLVAPLFFKGQVEFGVVTQSAMAFAHLVGAFSLIITQFQSISSYAAVVSRLDALDEGIERARSRSGIQVLSRGDALTFEKLSLRSPDGRLLTNELEGSVAAGSRLLIRGANEEAKSALFRATAGSWSSGSGRIVRPDEGRILFVAERPYLPQGTLREILTDPGREIPAGEIRAALRDVELDASLDRFGGLEAERRWESLTLGEQKLLAFARVLLSAPRFVFLERPGTGLGAGTLERILKLLAERCTAVLTIGEEVDARRAYDAALELDVDGGWRWRPFHAAP